MTFTHKFDKIMRKYIFILNAINVMAKLLKEKRVEGVLSVGERLAEGVA